MQISGEVSQRGDRTCRPRSTRFPNLPQPATIGGMNVVFDLGGVVLTWEPEKLIAAHFPDSREAELVRDRLFRHQDWVETVSYTHLTLPTN